MYTHSQAMLVWHYMKNKSYEVDPRATMHLMRLNAKQGKLGDCLMILRSTAWPKLPIVVPAT